MSLLYPIWSTKVRLLMLIMASFRTSCPPGVDVDRRRCSGTVFVAACPSAPVTIPKFVSIFDIAKKKEAPIALPDRSLVLVCDLFSSEMCKFVFGHQKCVGRADCALGIIRHVRKLLIFPDKLIRQAYFSDVSGRPTEILYLEIEPHAILPILFLPIERLLGSWILPIDTGRMVRQARDMALAPVQRAQTLGPVCRHLLAFSSAA